MEKGDSFTSDVQCGLSSETGMDVRASGPIPGACQ